MIKHIVIWNYMEDISSEERNEKALQVKDGLEALKSKIPGVVEVKVVIDPLVSSNGAVMLVSAFESMEALSYYQEHPEHMKAVGLIKSFLCARKCVDYQE